MNPKQATRQVLYYETLFKDRYTDDDDPDFVMVSIVRWSTNDDAIAILIRETYHEGEYRIRDKSLITTNPYQATATLQRLGIRVFDELKAAHPTLCDE